MKDIRSKFVKESLLDYETLANSLKENTSIAVKDLLSEAVRETYTKILTEESEDEYEVEEVNDTDSENTNDAEDNSMELDGESELGSEGDADVADETQENGEELPIDSESEETEVEPIDAGSENDEWAEFDKYKVSDDEYDFSNAEDEEIVKVYKLLKDEDQVLVNVDKESQKVEIKDNQTGAEYLLDLSSFNGGGAEVAPEEPMGDDLDFGGNDAEGDLDFENENMNEQRIFEVVLNEYDSHVGYTDNYQKKDVMTTPSNEEPGKNVNDWDAGVPKGKSKPWAGKGESKPFEKKVNEEDEVMEETEETIEEAGMNVGGFVQQNSTSRSDVPNSNGRKARNMHQGAKQVKGTAEPRYSSATNESKMMSKVNKILKENEELKVALNKFKTVLQEAAVTNVNLGQIIKLISENSTTKAEKQEIIERFGKEAKTVEQSKSLYESISRELKKNNTNNSINLNEDKQFTTNGSKMINETQIYQSKDLLDSLDLMHRLCK